MFRLARLHSNRLLLSLWAAVGAHTLIEAGNAQALRAPDFGVWLSTERGANGASVVTVADLGEESIFAAAGLREGDRIVSINGRAIGSEVQFVQAILSPAPGNQPLNVVIA